MKQQTTGFEHLVSQLAAAHDAFSRQAQKQVNVAMTLRNWFCGYYIFRYEQAGEDRAKYGAELLPRLSRKLRAAGIKGMSETNLKLFRSFYQAYPAIGQAATDQFSIEALGQIRQSLTDELNTTGEIPQTGLPVSMLINKLSFTHIVEFLKIEEALKRIFYETEAIKNNWSVRELQRAVNSMLFERTGLSTDKESIKFPNNQEDKLPVENFFRSPYVLEFLNLEEKPSYSESDLEESIITHLQSFLMEMGRGFCFEARQKRITFDNTHYHIDLVFYHRVLKCTILLDLKLGEFTHADSGQMNVYLNYYRENEMTEGDNPPIGIILCAGKNENLVRYATSGLPQQIFVSKYLINLPSEASLREIIEEEQRKLKN